ncbi:MAG: GTPase domain-containing protein [Chloroflexota bacterium]
MKKQLVPAVTGLVFICLFGWYLDLTMRDEITKVVRYLLYLGAGLLLLGLVGVLVFAILIFLERYLQERASRKALEHEANVMVVKADEGQQVFIRDIKQATWRNAHLDTQVYATGQATDPNQVEVRLWQTYQLRHRPSVMSQVETPLLALPSQADLLTILDQAQVALVVGQRDAGKTTVLQHLISRRIGRSHVLVLDPHSHPTRWPQGCKVVGTERNFPKIKEALIALEGLMNKRYREIGRGIVQEGAHPSVTVIIDEWRAIVYNLGKPASNIIKTLLAESRKTNIDVFVGTHSERVKALGIEGEGDLKEGFVLARLTINKMTKERSATVDYGDGELPVTLPGSYVGHNPKAIIEPDLVSFVPTPTVQEQKILEMHQAGESLRSISKTAFDGKVGQFYNDKIREVLGRYGEK